MTHYPVEIFYSPEDAGYIATFPDLLGCSAFGETEEEALTEAKYAQEAWLSAQQTAGNAIPTPTTRTPENFSGKFLLRVPKQLHATLAITAKRQGVSLNQYVLYLLAQQQGKVAS
jgi:predicted RNase H-like HicB family nuclease